MWIIRNLVSLALDYLNCSCRHGVILVIIIDFIISNKVMRFRSNRNSNLRNRSNNRMLKCVSTPLR